MFKMVAAFVLLTLMIGSLKLAMSQADNPTKWKVVKALGFAAVCASAALVILGAIVIFF